MSAQNLDTIPSETLLREFNNSDMGKDEWMFVELLKRLASAETLRGCLDRANKLIGSQADENDKIVGTLKSEIARLNERLVQEDGAIGAFLVSEIRGFLETVGCKHGKDMSSTPPMMYPEAIVCAFQRLKDEVRRETLMEAADFIFEYRHDFDERLPLSKSLRDLATTPDAHKHIFIGKPLLCAICGKAEPAKSNPRLPRALQQGGKSNDN